MQAAIGRSIALRGIVARSSPHMLLQHCRAAPRSRRYSDNTVTRAVVETAPQANFSDEPQSSRVYADWTVYKTNGAMTMKFIKPTWNNTGSGYVVTRQGKILLEFAPSSGERQYAWDTKISIAISAAEFGQIVEQPTQEHSFYHDPNIMDASSKGSVSKALRWSMAPDSKVYFINASVGGSSAAKASVSVSLSAGEYFVFKQLGTYAVPHLLGVDMVFTEAT